MNPEAFSGHDKEFSSSVFVKAGEFHLSCSGAGVVVGLGRSLTGLLAVFTGNSVERGRAGG